jgi:hypothetical protein
MTPKAAFLGSFDERLRGKTQKMRDIKARTSGTLRGSALCAESGGDTTRRNRPTRPRTGVSVETPATRRFTSCI